MPDLLSVSESLGSGPRLRYPLGYWNANGVACGLGAALLLWTSRFSPSRVLRWISAGVLPAVGLTLYFTYSRGGLLALVIACGCLLALSHDRLWLLATLGVGAIGALPAILAVQSRDSLADNLANQAAVDQGVTVLAVLIAGVALALLLFAGLQRLEGRRGALTGRAVELSRNPKILRGIAAAIAVLAIAAVAAVGGRAWDQFSNSDIQFPNDPQQHFSDFSSAGRHDFWRVAIDAFEEEPVVGHGAGTYQFSWNQLRSIPISVHNAHSLYLEAFAELGIVGGLLILGLVGFLLWTGFAAWRHARGTTRELYGVLFAVALAFAVGAGIDWLWEIAALGAVFFLASGILVAGRCAQLSQDRAEADGAPEQRNLKLVVAGLAVAWITALALVGPLLVDHEIKASQSAASGGNLASAREHAETARSIEPWAASPYLQLGLVAEAEGDYPTAAKQLGEAIDREDRNWVLYYLRARVEHEAGENAPATADRAEAQRLNPLEECLREGWEGCG